MSLGFKYNFSSSAKALVITWVNPRGPAYEASLQEGDKILSVDGISAHEGDVLALLSKPAGESIELIVAPKPRAGSLDRALGAPLMGGVLYQQPPRTVTLIYRDLPEPNFFEQVQNFFTPPPPPPPTVAAGVGAAFGGFPSEGGPPQAGVGIGIRVAGGETAVTELAPGGPAERSRQVRVGDAVLAVDGQDIAGLPADTVRGLILGPPGSDVGLTIRRGAAAAAAAGVGGGGDVRLVTLRRSAIAPAAAPPDPYDPYGDGGFGDGGLDPPPPRLKPGWLGKELGKPWW